MRALGTLRLVAVPLGFGAFFTAFFWPVLSAGKPVVAGDALVEGLPAYFSTHVPWELNTMLGYPEAANPIQMYWYPLTLLHFVPGSFNVFIATAYVIAACGTFLLVRTETGSTLGGIAAGFTYALGGFMVSHNGHVDIIEPAAWTPFVLWSVAALRRGIRFRVVAGGAASLAMCALAGQPQVLTYTIVLAVGYALAAATRPGLRTQYVAAFVALLALGLGLSAVLLIPAWELAKESVRATQSLSEFTLYQVPPRELLIRAFFPYLLGDTSLAPYRFSNLGIESFPELTNYAGVTTLVLAIVGVATRGTRRAPLFWAIIALAALALSAGSGLGLTAITYHIPIVNLFGKAGRHAMEYTLAVAVLAGFGIAALEHGRASLKHVLIAGGVVGGLMALTIGVIAAFDQAFTQTAATILGIPAFPLDPLRNAAVGIPVASLVAGLVVASFFAKRPENPIVRCLLAAAVAADLSGFAWYGYWRNTPAIDLALPAYAAHVRGQLEQAHQRLVWLDEDLLAPPLTPNLSVYWRIPEVNGYVPLELARTAAFAHSMKASQAVLNPLPPEDEALRLSAVRFAFVPGRGPATLPASAPWSADDLDLSITDHVYLVQPELRQSFGRAIPATRLLIATSMYDSETIPDGAEVAEITLTPSHGPPIVARMLAGRDTSDGGYDLPAVRSVVRHARAAVLSSNGALHVYRAAFALPRRKGFTSVAIRWTYRDPEHGILHVDRLSLVDDARKIAYPVTRASPFLFNPGRWRLASTLPNAFLFENAAPGPRVWIVPSVRVVASPDAALEAIQHGTFDPRTTALLERPPPEYAAGPGRATIRSLSATVMSVEADCVARCFLITSDAFYDGWDVAVDGRPAELYRADFALRGVFVSAGRHAVVFSYRPWSAKLGKAITLGSALVLLAALARGASLGRTGP